MAHGPKKRSYDWSLPKKVRQKALRNAFYMFQEKKLIFVENMESKTAKTKACAFALLFRRIATTSVLSEL